MKGQAHAGLLALGEGHFVPLEEVTLIIPLNVAGDIDEDALIDATFQRRPRTVIFTRSGRTILSCLSPDEVAARYATGARSGRGLDAKEEN